LADEKLYFYPSKIKLQTQNQTTMKRMISSVLWLTLLLCLTYSPLSAGNGNGGGNHAIGVAKSQCGNNYHGQNVSWQVTSVAIGLCINGRTYEVYEVGISYSCPPQPHINCIRRLPKHVATVTFDCDGNVTVLCR
jgi:hypothetical protein